MQTSPQGKISFSFTGNSPRPAGTTPDRVEKRIFVNQVTPVRVSPIRHDQKMVVTHHHSPIRNEP